MRISTGRPIQATLFAFIGLAACATSGPEFDARLAGLRSSGIDAGRQSSYEARLQKALENEDNAAAARMYDVDTAAPGQTARLGEVLRAALDGNIEIARAARRIQRADAERLNAIFGYLPQVSATGNYNRINQNVISSDNAVFQAGKASYNAFDVSAEVTQPILDLNRIWGIRVANTLRSAAEVDYVIAVQKVTFDTFDAYVRAAQSKATVNAMRQRASLLRRQLSTQSVRETEGLTDPSQGRALEIDLATIGIEIANEQRRQSDALAELFSLTGKRFDDVEVAGLPTGARGTETRISAAAAANAAITANPRVLRGIIAVVEGDLRSKQALFADFAPVVAAFARASYEKRDASRFGGGSTTFDYVFGVRLVVPIFNARGQGYETLTARLDFRDAMLEYLQAKRTVVAEINAAHQRLVDLSQAISQARSVLVKATQQTRDEERRVEAGTSDPFFVTALKARELEARQTVQAYEFEYLRAWGELQYLMSEDLAGAG